MSNVGLAPGYLTDSEASHLTIHALPGAVVIGLRRALEGEGAAGRPVRRMFIELSLGEAVQHWRDMGELIRTAGALERPGLHTGLAWQPVMEHLPASVTAAEFEVLARRAGLVLNEAQAGVLYGVYGHFEAMVGRLREPLDAPRGRGAEPSLVFVPGQGWGGL